jgi:hypothetical protein
MAVVCKMAGNAKRSGYNGELCNLWKPGGECRQFDYNRGILPFHGNRYSAFAKQHLTLFLPSSMQRIILGVMAIVLFLSAVVLLFAWPEGTGAMAMAFCWRMATVLTAAWLAYDDIQRLPNWIIVTLPVCAIILVRWPRLLLALIPFVIALSFLHSRLFRRS